MKSITLFIASLSGGGAEHQMAILADLLVTKGYNVTLATFTDIDDHYSVSNSIKRVRLAPAGSSLRKVWAIFWFFLRLKTDCVISFSQRSNFLCLIPLLFRPGIRVISSERNITMGPSSKMEKVLFNFLYNRSSFIVPNSFTQARYIKKKSPSLSHKVFPIINYTDIESFSPSGPSSGDKKKIAVFARVEKQKNCLRFASVLARLKAEGNWSFIVEWYGNHSFQNPVLADYVVQVEAAIRDLSIEDVFVLHNPVKDVSSLMPSFDAICLPSIYEGFSNSVAEGISCGKAMIVSDVSDNHLMVVEGKNGFLFDPTDEESMMSAFHKLFVLSKKDLSLMGKESRSIAENLFDKEKFINNYISLIEGK